MPFYKNSTSLKTFPWDDHGQRPAVLAGWDGAGNYYPVNVDGQVNAIATRNYVWDQTARTYVIQTNNTGSGPSSNVNVTNASLPVSGSVIANQGIPNTTANAWPAADDYGTYVAISDLAPGTYTNQTISSPINLLVVRVVGAVGRCAPDGGTVGASTGIYCPDGEPIYIPMRTQRFSMYVPTGANAYLYGLGRS